MSVSKIVTPLMEDSLRFLVSLLTDVESIDCKLSAELLRLILDTSSCIILTYGLSMDEAIDTIDPVPDVTELRFMGIAMPMGLALPVEQS